MPNNEGILVLGHPPGAGKGFNTVEGLNDYLHADLDFGLHRVDVTSQSTDRRSAGVAVHSLASSPRPVIVRSCRRRWNSAARVTPSAMCCVHGAVRTPRAAPT